MMDFEKFDRQYTAARPEKRRRLFDQLVSEAKNNGADAETKRNERANKPPSGPQ